MILSIEKEYLLSIVPELVQGFKNNKFQSKERIEMEYQERLEAQAQELSQRRASYPVVLEIYGAIVKHSTYYYVGTQTYKRYLQRLDQMSEVSAIILDIDSGGGMVSGTEELASVIRGIEKPIVAYTNGYMCSAAYWIGAACDKVVSSPYADAIGSIGTMLHTQDYSQMFEKWGAKIYEVYAPESTEKNKLWRDLVAGNTERAQERLSELAQHFIGTMKDYRPAIKDDGKVFNGAIYSPAKALEVGLVDEIMTLEEVLNNF